MAVTRGSFSSADDAAANIYGAPGDATRMSRMKNIASEALSETPNGISGEDNASPAFIDGSTVGGFKETEKVRAGGGVPGGSPGFPGIDDDYYPEAEKINPSRGPVSAPKAVTAQSSKSNNPAVQGSPGFPGLP